MLNHDGSELLELVENHLVSLAFSIKIVLLNVFISEVWWDIPEADVGGRGLNSKLKLLWVSLNEFCNLMSLIESVVGLLGVSLNTVSLETHPELESVVLSSAGKGLITKIVIRVLGLVEEVGGTGVIGGLEGSLLVVGEEESTLSWHGKTLMWVD